MNENREAPESSPDVIARITHLADTKDHLLTRKTKIFPFIDFEKEAETRNNFLTNPVFLNNFNHANQYFRLPHEQKILSVENHLKDCGCQNPQEFLHERERFLETLIPLAISIAYQNNAISKRINFLARVGDFSTVQELFGNIYLQLIESATAFRWESSSPERETHGFINYLKKSLLDVVKLQVHEQIERQPDPDVMQSIIEQEPQKLRETEDAAITLILAISLKKTFRKKNNKP